MIFAYEDTICIRPASGVAGQYELHQEQIHFGETRESGLPGTTPKRNEVSERIGQLKMLAPDGKMRLTEVLREMFSRLFVRFVASYS